MCQILQKYHFETILVFWARILWKKKISLETPFPGLKSHFEAILAFRGRILWKKKKFFSLGTPFPENL